MYRLATNGSTDRWVAESRVDILLSRPRISAAVRIRITTLDILDFFDFVICFYLFYDVLQARRFGSGHNGYSRDVGTVDEGLSGAHWIRKYMQVVIIDP